MEKRIPHYNLGEIKAEFSDADNLGLMTLSARNGIRALQFSDEDVVSVITQVATYWMKVYEKMSCLWQQIYKARNPQNKISISR